MTAISVYILADTYFISRYSGADGLAVLNLIIPFFCLILAVGNLISTGFATRYKLERASGRPCDFYFVEAIVWGLIVSIPFVVTAAFFTLPILEFLGAERELALLGNNYFKVIMFATPLEITSYCFIAFTRNDNNPRACMIGSVSGSLLNILFDYIFMFVLDLGLEGAALATAFCPVISIIVCGLHLFGKNGTVGFKFNGLHIKKLLSCCRLGIPSFMGELSTSITTAVYNALILSIAGTTAVAAFGIICNISCVAIAIFNGLAEGSQPLFSECYGKGYKDILRGLLKLAVYITLGLEALVMIICMCFPDSIIAVFNSHNDVLLLQYAHQGMLLYFIGYAFAGINTLLLSYFASTDNPKPSAAGSVLRGIVAISAFAIVLSKYFGMAGIWLSYPCAEAFTLVVVIIMGNRRKK